MLLGIQIIAIVFAIVMMYLTFLYFKRKDFNKLQLILWEILWLGFLFVAIFPDSVNSITEQLGIVRAMDLFMIVGFVFIISLSFYNYIVVSKLKKSLEKYVRKEALNDLDTKNE